MDSESTSCELTILMPCLNEAETLEVCIKKAMAFLAASGITGEVLISDNGSTDGSKEIAERCGARVVDAPVKGYGAALIEGTKAARGTYIIMGDADDSYDSLHLQQFVDELREGMDLVMGNRFAGGIAKGAMPPLHKYLGNPVLSFIGRLFFHSKINDFHCGLRGFNKDSVLTLNLETTGMEYASEMVVKATLAGLRITEVPTTLSKDGRSHPPHLRSWHDGWRHLKFLLMYCPDWCFFYPGCLLLCMGLAGSLFLLRGDMYIGNTGFGLGAQTLVFMSAFILLGFNLILFYIFVKVFASTHGYLLEKRKNSFIHQRISPDNCVILGCLIFILGLAFGITAFLIWEKAGFGVIDISKMLRITLVSTVCMVIGLETIFAGFFVGIHTIKQRGG